MLKFFNGFDFTGAEIEPTLSWLKQNYPNSNWIKSDFEQSPKEEFDVIICSDVIEHLIDPDDLINFCTPR